VKSWRPFDWQSPEELEISAEGQRGVLGPLALKGPGKDFREAYVAAKFATARGADLVRLLEPNGHQPTPDFAISLFGSELWFETTEIDRPNRRRGDEVRTSLVESIPDDEWISPNAYAVVTHQRVDAKTKKNYSKCDGLVIWSNGFPIENESTLTLEWWQSAARPASDIFSETWVHHGSRFERLF